MKSSWVSDSELKPMGSSYTKNPRLGFGLDLACCALALLRLACGAQAPMREGHRNRNTPPSFRSCLDEREPFGPTASAFAKLSSTSAVTLEA